MLHRKAILVLYCLCQVSLAQDVWDIGITITSSAPLQPLNTSSVTAQEMGLIITSTDVSNGVPCPAGYYCDANGVWACPRNTYNVEGGASITDCISCPPYEVTNMTAQLSCASCQAGTRLAVSGSGAAPGNPDRRCVQCSAGSESPANSTNCYACGPGHYSTPGSMDCSACPAGTWSNAIGAGACSSCAPYTYTFSVSVHPTTGQNVYTPTTGATQSWNCLDSPIDPTYGVVCLPGSFRDGGSCTPCSPGYYCPIMSDKSSDISMLLCPTGTYSSQVGAKSAAECSSKLPPLAYVYQTCPIASSGEDALTALTVQAVCAPKASEASVFLATATHVYRLMLQTLVIQTIASISTATTPPTNISALGVDLNTGEAHTLIVGDSGTHNVFYTNLDTMTTTSIGIAQQPGGIALRSYQLSGPTYQVKRLAYVSDVAKHCIRVYDIDQAMQLADAAGLSNNAGAASGVTVVASAARFNAPHGIAFIEHDMATARYLLIADSGNGVIRILDTMAAQPTVGTWFAPQAKDSPEMITPTSIAVAVNGDGDTIVYVVDTGFSPPRLSALTKPTGSSLVLLTVMNTQSVSGFSSLLIPGPDLMRTVSGTGAIGTGVKDIVYVNSTGKVQCMLEASLASNSLDVSGAQCVYPSHAVNATLESLCGNLYLDAGEQCDTGNVAGTGCVACVLQSGWACAGNQESCLTPCAAFQHTVSYMLCVLCLAFSLI
jgi:Tyrosine-protein kinase ephrin type A/B receptor-like